MVKGTAEFDRHAAVAAYKADPTRANADRAIRLWQPVGMLIAWTTVRKKWGGHINMDDLGIPGAVMASIWDILQRFDPAMGFRFNSFLQHRVRGACLDQLRRQGRCADRPYGAAYHARQRERSLEQIQERMTWGSESDRLLDLTVATEEYDIHRKRSKDAIRKVIVGLSNLQKLSIMLYYLEGMTMRQIAEVAGVTEAMISLTMKGAMDILSTRSTTIEILT